MRRRLFRSPLVVLGFVQRLLRVFANTDHMALRHYVGDAGGCSLDAAAAGVGPQFDPPPASIENMD